MREGQNVALQKATFHQEMKKKRASKSSEKLPATNRYEKSLASQGREHLGKVKISNSDQTKFEKSGLTEKAWSRKDCGAVAAKNRKEKGRTPTQADGVDIPGKRVIREIQCRKKDHQTLSVNRNTRVVERGGGKEGGVKAWIITNSSYYLFRGERTNFSNTRGTGLGENVSRSPERVDKNLGSHRDELKLDGKGWSSPEKGRRKKILENTVKG